MATGALTEAVFSLPGEGRRGSVALVRDFARRVTATCGYRGSREDAVLVVSELTTNAVRYGGGRPFVRIVGAHDHLLVEVLDDSPDHPRPRAGGWGVRLVERLSTRWGVGERGGQKVVWCELTA